ncbi:MAG: FadR/GntR family transcriptional regulator [Pontibacterium sp.]
MDKVQTSTLNKRSLSAQIADQLQHAIEAGDLKANDRLPNEETLAQRYQVSRATIREALKRLAAKKLIGSKRGPAGGSFVLAPDIEALGDNLRSTATLLVGLEAVSVAEMMQVRKEFESSSCRLAAQHATDTDIQRLSDALDHQSDPILSDESFCAADVRFHRLVVEAAHNPMLSYMMYGVIEALQPVANLATYRERERSVILAQHTRLLEAIKTSNAQEAVIVIQEQMAYMEAMLIATQQARGITP